MDAIPGNETNPRRHNILHTDAASDPLLEQMSYLLRAGWASDAPVQNRSRRFSDTDRPAPAVLPAASAEPTSVLSRDGSRWLPAPDEQSQRYRNPSSSSNADGKGQTPTALADIDPHTCSAGVCAVKKVFETTELLELVLSFLGTSDVLNMRRTNHQWDATINQSPQLRLHFFTYGQWNRPGGQFQLLPLKLPGLEIARGKELRLGQWILISMTPKAARSIARHPRLSKRVRSRSIFEGLRGGLGSRTHNSSDTWPASQSTPTINSNLDYEDLYVTQPPLLGIQAFLVMPHTSEPSENAARIDDMDGQVRACAKLSCEAGITLGFLAETAQSIINTTDPAPSNIEDGKVVFKAIMSFTEPQDTRKKRSSKRNVVRLSV